MYMRCTFIENASQLFLIKVMKLNFFSAENTTKKKGGRCARCDNILRDNEIDLKLK